MKDFALFSVRLRIWHDREIDAPHPVLDCEPKGGIGP